MFHQFKKVYFIKNNYFFNFKGLCEFLSKLLWLYDESTIGQSINIFPCILVCLLWTMDARRFRHMWVIHQCISSWSRQFWLRSVPSLRPVISQDICQNLVFLRHFSRFRDLCQHSPVFRSPKSKTKKQAIIFCQMSNMEKDFSSVWLSISFAQFWYPSSAENKFIPWVY